MQGKIQSSESEKLKHSENNHIETSLPLDFSVMLDFSHYFAFVVVLEQHVGGKHLACCCH